MGATAANLKIPGGLSPENRETAKQTAIYPRNINGLSVSPGLKQPETATAHGTHQHMTITNLPKAPAETPS